MSISNFISWGNSIFKNEEYLLKKHKFVSSPYMKVEHPKLYSIKHDKKDFSTVAQAVLNEFYAKTGVVPSNDVEITNLQGEFDIDISQFSLTEEELKVSKVDSPVANKETLSSYLSLDSNFAKKTLEYRNEIQKIIGEDYGEVSLEERKIIVNDRIKDYKKSIREEVLLLCTQAIYLTTGRVLRKTQLESALAMQDYLVDMKTGEGKTLAVIVATYFNALDGRGAFVTSANGYLAERDALEAAKILGAMGISVGYADPNVNDNSVLQQAFSADVTYSTIDKFIFTQLSDERALTKDNIINPRGLNYMINDECDHTYLEKAIVPFIFSDSSEKYDVDRLALKFADDIVTNSLVFNNFEEISAISQNDSKLFIYAEKREKESESNIYVSGLNIGTKCLAYNINDQFIIRPDAFGSLAEKWINAWDDNIKATGYDYSDSRYGSREIFNRWKKDFLLHSGYQTVIREGFAFEVATLMREKEREFIREFDEGKKDLSLYISDLEKYSNYMNNSDFSRQVAQVKQNPTKEAIRELSLNRIRLFYENQKFDISEEYAVTKLQQAEFLMDFEAGIHELDFYINNLEKYSKYLDNEEFSKKIEEIKENPTREMVKELSLERIKLYHEKLEFDFNTMFFYTSNAVKAHYQFKNEEDYRVTSSSKGNRKVVLIDKSTGRIAYDELTATGLEKAPGQRLADGLHQAIEQKEKVNITSKPTQALGRYTIASYIKSAKAMVTGITGTALENADELSQLYGFDTYAVSKYKISPIQKEYSLYKTGEDKRNALVKTAVEAAKKGQPVLLTALNIEDAESLYMLIEKELNGDDSVKLQSVTAKGAKTNASKIITKADESRVIAHAGRKSTITVSTHMAGRGTDIKLAGSSEIREEELLFNLKAQKLLEMYPESQNFLSVFTGKADEKMMRLYGTWVNRFNSIVIENEKELVENLKVSLIQEAKEIRDAGGLLVLADGLPDNLRIQNQREGRTARCGDPGDIKWFVSLDDEVLKNNLTEKQQEKLESALGNEESLTFFEQIPGNQPKVSKKVNALIMNAVKINESKNTQMRIEIQKNATMINSCHKGYVEGYNELLYSDDPKEIFLRAIKNQIQADVESCFGEGKKEISTLRDKYLGLLVSEDAFPDYLMSSIEPEVLISALVERANWFLESAEKIDSNIFNKLREENLEYQSEQWASFLESTDVAGIQCMLSQEREKDYNIAIQTLWTEKKNETRSNTTRNILMESVKTCAKALKSGEAVIENVSSNQEVRK